MRNVRILQEIEVHESISGDKFVTGSRINAPATAPAQTLSSQKSPKMVLCDTNDHVFIKKTGALNSI